MVANELTFAVLALVVLLAIAFFAVYRKTGTVTVGAIDLYLCLHNLKYIILLRLSPFFYYSSILFDTPPKKLTKLTLAKRGAGLLGFSKCQLAVTTEHHFELPYFFFI